VELSPPIKSSDPTNFNLFKKRCEYWRDELGLWDWDFGYEYEELEGEEDDTCVLAGVMYLIDNKHAMMYLNSDLGNDASPETINKVALHEILEVLIARLKNSMLTDKVDEHAVEEQTHEVINRLLRYMLRNDGEDNESG